MCNERKLEAISKPSIIIRLYVMETKNKLKESKVNRRQPTEISVRLCRFVCLNVCICGGINLVPSCLLTIPFSFSKYLSLCPSISLASLPPCVISLIGRQGPIINWYINKVTLTLEKLSQDELLYRVYVSLLVSRVQSNVDS